ncbi:MAG: DUF2298 domain-containing protein [Candidatus Methanoperedens sp.]|nr:DUF2298 domain-containing protein [Candidatus Methanoperedens sp.]
MSETVFILVWLLIVEFIGFAAFPLIASFINLPDRGYSISKLIGLLLVTYLVWVTVSLGILGFGLAVVVFSLAVLCLISLRKFGPELLSLKSIALKSELVFVVSFLALTLVVMNKPDIYGPHSEDFMDFAFLQSLLRSTHFPPPDPWMAGENLSYYYFGQLIVAILIKLSSIPSNIAYNLAVAMFFALTAQAAYGVGYNLTRRSFYGITGALFVAVSGIMSGFLQLAAYLVPAARKYITYAPLQVPDIHQWFLKFDFWNSISIIPQTFNFYPYHTFAHGYLHAHMMSIPFQVMLITLGLGLFIGGKVERRDILLLGVSIGFFAGLNIWEYPTYLLFAYLIFILIRKEEALKLGAQTAVLSLILYLPYYLSRDSGGFGGVMPVPQGTSLLDFLEVFALFVVLILSFLFVYFWQRRENIKRYAAKLLAAAPLLVLVSGVTFHLQALLLLATMVLASAYGMLRFRGRDERFVLLLVLLGSLVALFPEVLYIVDAMPVARFNTIMKLHLEVWVLWGLASSYAIYYVLGRGGNSRFKKIAGAAWSMAVVFLVLASLVHPIASTTSWTSGKTFFGTSTRGTLDGTAYLEKTNREDYMAIRWINGNITGNEFILEAPGSAYEYSSRISTLTGLPTVIGWTSHEHMWNNNWSKVEERAKDVDIIYSTTDKRRAIELLKKYSVQYVYIGDIETGKYPQAGLQKFNDGESFEPVYNDTVQILKVK